MPIINLILIAAAVFVAIIVVGAIIGVLTHLFQCLIFAAVIAIGVAVITRLLAARQPASKQVIDQPPHSNEPVDDRDQVIQQIEARKKRLDGR